MKTLGINYIIFLQISETLPSTYFYMHEYFMQYDISVVPVHISDLAELDNGIEQTIVAVSGDISSRKRILQFQKRYINFLLLSGKHTLFDISSFSKLDFGHRVVKRGCYLHFQMPTSISEVCQQILAKEIEQQEKPFQWNYGKKASASFL